MTDISFITDTISIYRKKRYLKRRYDTDNIGIADIIDDIDTIDPSLDHTLAKRPTSQTVTTSTYHDFDIKQVFL